MNEIYFILAIITNGHDDEWHTLFTVFLHTLHHYTQIGKQIKNEIGKQNININYRN